MQYSCIGALADLQKDADSPLESRVFSLEAFDLEGNNLFRGGDLFAGKLDDASGGVHFSALAMQSDDQLIAFDSSTPPILLKCRKGPVSLLPSLHYTKYLYV